jgi:ribokinase
MHGDGSGYDSGLPMPSRIVVFGSLNMDFVAKVRQLPLPGETTLGSGFQTIPGGKGANQACAAGRAGAGTVQVLMAGRVGRDSFGEQLKASLSAAGVDVSFVQVTEAEPSGAALIWVDATGQNSIVVASGANFTLTESEIEDFRPAFTGAACALFQLESPLPAVTAGLRLASGLGARTILDPAPAQPLSAQILRHVDILTPNESEACLLLREPLARVTPADAPRLATQLLQLGPRSVVIKLGDAGCFFSDGRREIFMPPFRVKAIDATAAGDMFNGSLAVALAEGQDMESALKFANAASAISVTRSGAQSSVPTRSEVEAFLRSCAS